MASASPPPSPPVTAARVVPPQLKFAWRQTILVGSVAGLCSAAAALTQLASKVNASAEYPYAGHGAVRYDAGWPLTYAHVAMDGLGARSFTTTVHGSPRLHAIFWGAFTLDVMILALVFALALGVIVGLWSLVWRSRPGGSLKRFVQLAALGLALATGWLMLSFWIISGINSDAPTDAATRTQITQPPALLYLAPGVGQYLTQRWFDGDGGPAIALTGGPAAMVAATTETMVSVALPAALLTLVLTHGMRLRAWWAKQ